MSSFGYDLLGFGSSANTAIATPSDDDFNRVSFLSHFEGANNGVNNAFDDGSSSNHTITAAGNATQGSFGPFARDAGNWSVNYTATDSPFTKVLSDGTNLGAGTGAYTVEAWINWSEWAGTNQRIWLMGRAGADFIVLGKQADENRLFTKGDTIDYDFTPNLGQWYHIAVVRASTGTNGLSLYIDGTRVAQGQDTSTVDAEDFFVSGLDWATGYNLRGKASNFRYTKSAVYSGASFTVPDGPLTAITNTEILMCQDNRFVDNSIRARAISIGGSPSVSSFGPFLTTSVYDAAVNGASGLIFNAQSDSIALPLNGDFALSGDFCVETWLYGSGGDRSLYVSRDSSYFALNISITAAQFNIYLNAGSPTWTPSHTVKANAWHHLALTRSGNTLKLFQDGVSLGTYTFSNTLGYSSPSEHRIGGGASGALSTHGSFRIVKGSPVYTSNFTPPTAPLTAITNTELLLNMADGQAIDSAAQNNMTLLGNTKLSTTQAKFGDTSMLFATSEADKLDLGDVFWTNSDWTHEFWTYLNSNSTATRIIFTQYTGQVVNGRCVIQYINSTGKIMWFIGVSGGNITMDVTMSKGAWHHVALTRSGNDYKLFVDGTAGSTGSSSQDLESSVNTILGPSGFSTSGQGIDGFIDDLRFSKFVRYTNNFTAPTAPFADKGQ